MASDRILQTKQIAAEIGACTKTVSRLYHAGKLTGAFKLGKTSPIRIHEADLKKYKKRAGR